MPQDYQSQFRAFYDPNLRTEANISLPGVGYGEGSGGGGIDIDSILRTVWGYKQRAAAAEAARQEAAAAAAAERQREALKYQADLGLETAQQARSNDIRAFYTNKKDLDMIQTRDPWAGQAYGQAQGRDYFNMPAASALTYGKDIFPDGFRTYSEIADAGSGVGEEAIKQAGETQRQRDLLSAGYGPNTGR